MHRKIESSYSGADYGENYNPIEEIKNSLKDCSILLTAKIGECPMGDLNEIGIICDESYANQPIEKSVFESLQKHFRTNEKELG
jgi:nitrogen fixation protein NifB